MSVDPNVGPAYQYPADSAPTRPVAPDPGFNAGPQNPDGSDIGPLYLSPEAEDWVEKNVTDFGYVIDWGTREIIDPNTSEVKGTVPTAIPRMI